MQVPDSIEMISEPNQILESQPTTDKNPQSTTQNAQHDNRDIAMDSLVKESKEPMNCPFSSKRRWALTRKQQAVKWTQEQLQAYGQPIEPVPTTKQPKVLSKPTRL